MSILMAFGVVDQVAFGVFVIAWLGHFWMVSHNRWRRATITWHMFGYRQRLMKTMIRRDAHMTDALIHNGLQQGVLFFGSTSILLIGALITGLGASDQAMDVLQDLPFATTTSRTEWELKVLLVTLILVFAFFKFAWSFRLFSYVIIVIGGAPGNDADAEERDRYALMTARLHALAARHFTIGLHAYFFALAAVAWFLNAWLFMLATAWVSAVLYRRTFHSQFMKELAACDPQR